MDNLKLKHFILFGHDRVEEVGTFEEALAYAKAHDKSGCTIKATSIPEDLEEWFLAEWLAPDRWGE